MTLLVAGIEGETAWMVADASISGGNLQVRDREIQIKIVRAADRKALIGFAGDQHHGTRFIEQARLLQSGPNVVDALLQWHREFRSVEFAYAYQGSDRICLVRIADGISKRVLTLHLGVGFSQFQSIRHRRKVDPAPRAISQLYSAGRSIDNPPEQLGIALRTMLYLFAERRDRDVGGFVLPYYLTQQEAFLLNYGYSVSDPILPQLRPGARVPHGTAALGGFSISLTELGIDEGIVVYWLQKPGGIVFLREGSGYKELQIHGTPSKAKSYVFDNLGKNIDLWFNELDPNEPLDKALVVHDSQGKPAFAIGQHGRNLTMSALNTSTEFYAKAHIELTPATQDQGRNCKPSGGSAAGIAARVHLPIRVDALIAKLASFRRKWFR